MNIGLFITLFILYTPQYKAGDCIDEIVSGARIIIDKVEYNTYLYTVYQFGDAIEEVRDAQEFDKQENIRRCYER